MSAKLAMMTFSFAMMTFSFAMMTFPFAMNADVVPHPVNKYNTKKV